MKKIVSVCICFVLFLTGCSVTNSTGSIKIIDQLGRTVELPDVVEKVISGYYITTTALIGLGQKDKLVGIEMKPESRPIYKASAPEVLELPQLGNKKMFNVEECAKLDPDVVFLPISLKNYEDDLEALDIPVIYLNPETDGAFDEALDIIGKVLNCEDSVQNFKKYQDNLLNEYTFESDYYPSVYFAGNNILSAASSEMYQNEIIEFANGKNIVTTKGYQWQNLTAESLIRSNPDFIFIENGMVNLSDVYSDSRLQNMNAIQKKNVYLFPSSLETWDTPGLSSCLGKIWATAILHPNVFTKEDIKKDSVQFYKEFFGFEPTREQLGF